MIAKSPAPRHPLFPAPPAPRPWWVKMLGMNKGLKVECPAKINLFLHVTGRRDDGYHELQSWMAFAEIADVIHLREAKHYHLIADGPFARALPPMTENLITKTVNLLAARHRQKPNFMIELTKNLPVGAGLGGGSANAAAVARALQYFWGFDWQPEDAEFLAHHLGADVPACLAGRSCIVTGMGEQLTPAAPIPKDCHVVLVYPSAVSSTTEVFGLLSEPYTPPVTVQSEIATSLDLVQFLQHTRNDLMHPAMGLEPKILQGYRALTRQPGCLLARMTGSGSVCFGIFADEETARSAATVIRQQEPAWWVRATRFLTA